MREFGAWIAVVVASLAWAISLPAHTISIGFENAGPGSVTFWVGNYTHGAPGSVPTEGELLLNGVGGTVFGPLQSPFNMSTIVKPAGLVDGTTNFYVSGPLNGVGFPLVNSDADFLSQCPACGPVTGWQGLTVNGLLPGDYQFFFVEAPFPTANWTQWNDSLNRTFTLTGQIVNPAAPVPEPGTITLLGLGLLGLVFAAARRRRLC